MGVFGFGKSMEEKEQEAIAHYKAAQDGQFVTPQEMGSPRRMNESTSMSTSDSTRMPTESDNGRSQQGMRGGRSIPVSMQDGEQRFESYTVQRGDTLNGIAHWFYGDRSEWLKIYAANRETIRDPDDLLPGQVLRVPRRDRTDLA